ncbi:MAG: S41 family peptidase [Bacteroidales bacterium]|nr:S41 family peptidase [Bacteroidales bacterium]
MVKKFSLSFIVIVFCLLNTINSFSQIDDEKYFEMNKAIETFGSVFKSLHSNYVDELNSGDLVKTAIDAMLAKLDPYTNFYPESEMEEVKLQYLGQYGGIGALIHYKNGIVYISEPYEGLPAYKAGVKAGDAILSIDGESAKGKTSNQVSEKLRGQAGTEIELELERDGKIIKKTFRREDIQLPNVPYFGMIDSVVGYIKLNEFTKEASKHVQEAFENLKRQNMQYLIFDLRGNGGGLLQEAVNIVNLFVDKGQVVVSTKAKTVEKNSVFKTTKKAIDTKIPIVVLIDGTSASASEIVSGSLQDFDRAVIMGQCSFGKGLVQNILPLIYNSQIKVTVSKYYIPSGRCIQAIDYSHRDKDGKANKIPDSLRTAFKTKGGRTVYDGLGIEPDITIAPEYASNIAIALISKFLCFDYATKFVKENPSIASAKDFDITDEIYNDFIEYLKDKDYNYTTSSERILEDLISSAKKEKLGDETLKEIEKIKTQIAEDKSGDLIKYKEDIKEILLSEIVVRYYNQKGRIEALLKHDNEVKEATKLLYDQKQYNKTLGK